MLMFWHRTKKSNFGDLFFKLLDPQENSVSWLKSDFKSHKSRKKWQSGVGTLLFCDSNQNPLIKLSVIDRYLDV